ncbi:helix-turn-helix transcriptional regulator [Streptomyces sp. RerS4]|uniref:helix-turn-helix domain-containing protein n=1 Tax=Streptomyces sp. RerS4 TaxID=2942449 RepID=UPI00201BF4CD|nr:helix-turn-helix transcriptional regulator [Streptomyces sp. RerS4]UQW99189.1 helix-turn-helix domain-containing protein [Streptomyces sp. RerS4]
MPIGALIRDMRKAKQWTQVALAGRLGESAGRPDGSPSADMVKRWEREKVIPGPFWLSHLAKVFAIRLAQLEAEARLSDVKRRSFLALGTLVAAHGTLAGELVSSVAMRDPGPLMAVQTTHGTDIVIASWTDKASTMNLRRWMNEGEAPILRVNAAGILAKQPGQDQAFEVARVLEHDEEVRTLYITAVTSRVCALDWTTAGRVVRTPSAYAQQAHFLASRFSAEALNPRDAGARWCSFVMLRELSPLIGWSQA